MGVIKLKRGNNVNLPNLTLEAGEPAFVLDTGKLYVGNGTDKILINPDQPNAETATKLQTARTIALTGDVTGSVSFDGSANVSINTTVGDDSHNHVISNIDGLQTALDGKAATGHTHTLVNITDAGTAAAKDVGTAAGNVPVLDAAGKLDTSILPGLALTTTNVVSSQTAMLALTAEPGDIAIRTDLNKTYILKSAPASTLANWQELLSPTDSVTSVNGQTGAVTISSISGNAGTATKLATARTISLGGDLSGSASFDGSSNISITATVADDSHNHTIANVDGLQAALDSKLNNNSVIDGGTF